ncbi:MAG: FHA domain-containing protein [Planctomycetota bacterium]|nr:MAG: FHA domain-containing protein [Planctomycetota bacterium]
MPDLLVYVKGAAAQRRKVRFVRSRLVIGRASECDITLGHGTLSRQHLAIYEEDGQWYVEDLGSSNGTRLNGAKISAAEALGDGDRIGAGRVRLIISGLGGRRTSIFRNRSVAADAGDEMDLGDLDYGDGYLDGDELAAIDDDDDGDMQSLDLDGDDAEFAEIELNTMIRSAVDGDLLAGGKAADSDKLAAWDDLFGEVDEELREEP